MRFEPSRTTVAHLRLKVVDEPDTRYAELPREDGGVDGPALCLAIRELHLPTRRRPVDRTRDSEAARCRALPASERLSLCEE